jgi:hypothetical protein
VLKPLNSPKKKATNPRGGAAEGRLGDGLLDE